MAAVSSCSIVWSLILLLFVLFMFHKQRYESKKLTSGSGDIARAPASPVGIWFRGAAIVGPSGDVDEGRHVLIENGRFRYVGPSAQACRASMSGDPQRYAVVDASRTVLCPGLIDAHTKLAFGHQKSATIDQTYSNRFQWVHGTDGASRLQHDPPNYSQQTLAFNALRHLTAGTTAMVTGTGLGVPGPVRPLDDIGGPGDAGVETRTWPFAARPPNQDVHLEPGTRPTWRRQHGQYEAGAGTDEVARRWLDTASQRLIGSKSAFVGAMTGNARVADRLQTHGASVVWTPRSDVNLYANTAPIPLYLERGVNVALGTNWNVTGSTCLLNELKAADEVNRKQWDGRLSDADLLRMATLNGAIATGFEAAIGSIETGKAADFVAFDRFPGKPPQRSVIEAGKENVRLVAIDGRAEFGELSWMKALAGGDPLQGLKVGKREKGLRWDDRHWGMLDSENANRLHRYVAEQSGLSPIPLDNRSKA